MLDMIKDMLSSGGAFASLSAGKQAAWDSAQSAFAGFVDRGETSRNETDESRKTNWFESTDIGYGWRTADALLADYRSASPSGRRQDPVARTQSRDGGTEDRALQPESQAPRDRSGGVAARDRAEVSESSADRSTARQEAAAQGEGDHTEVQKGHKAGASQASGTQDDQQSDLSAQSSKAGRNGEANGEAKAAQNGDAQQNGQPVEQGLKLASSADSGLQNGNEEHAEGELANAARRLAEQAGTNSEDANGKPAKVQFTGVEGGSSGSTSATPVTGAIDAAPPDLSGLHAQASSRIADSANAASQGRTAAGSAQQAAGQANEQQPQVNIDQLAARTVRWRHVGILDNGGSARIRLDPPELGSVDVILRTSGNTVRIEMTVESEAVGRQLQSQSERLVQALQNHGLQAGRIDVQVASQPEQTQEGQEQQGQGDQPTAQQQHDGRQGAEEEPDRRRQDDSPFQRRMEEMLNTTA